MYRKKADGGFDQIVHVSYMADTPTEAQVIEATAGTGLSGDQVDVLINKVHPAVKALEGADAMTPAALDQAKAKVKEEMKKVVNVNL